jgi:ubiquinone/menaquinone biosynthesis C-methylase UbiE
MSKYRDPKYLKNIQYKDSFNLSARADLHRYYSTNPQGWLNWVFDQIQINTSACILEIGCGPGYLWLENRQHLRQDWKIILTDLSQGMLVESRQALGSDSSFRFCVVDATQIPYSTSSFDLVIANHMLFHVPDIDQTISEIERVLKPGHCLYAATNGRNHLTELKEWQNQFFPNHDSWGNAADHFGLENGEEILRQSFSAVKRLTYPDSLEVTNVEPLIAYFRSTHGEDLDIKEEENLRSFLSSELNENKSIKITKEVGLFIARN